VKGLFGLAKMPAPSAQIVGRCLQQVSQWAIFSRSIGSASVTDFCWRLPKLVARETYVGQAILFVINNSLDILFFMNNTYAKPYKGGYAGREEFCECNRGIRGDDAL
jgi:hypothetical protein